MESDTSADDPVFTDCLTPVTQSALATRRQRQMSVPEMVKRAENRQPKRAAPDRSSRSPRDSAQPAAKRLLPGPAEPAESAEPPAVALSTSALAAIRQLIDQGMATVIKAFETKFEQMEKRIDILEAENIEKDNELKRLGKHLEYQVKANTQLQAQVESIDQNRRLSSLILTCDDFGRRSTDENLEEKIVKILKERITELSLTTADIQAAHRLQKDNKVICKFIKRSVRDGIYDARFDLLTRVAPPRRAGPGGRGSVGSYSGRQLPPLYINESLTNYNQHLYNQLLQARKSSGGSKIASVFSRRGSVFCRTSKSGPNIRVPDEAALRRLLGGASSGAVRCGARSAVERGSGGRPARPGANANASASRPSSAGLADMAPPGPESTAATLPGTGVGGERSAESSETRLGETPGPHPASSAELRPDTAAGGCSVAAAGPPDGGAADPPPVDTAGSSSDGAAAASFPAAGAAGLPLSCAAAGPAERAET